MAFFGSSSPTEINTANDKDVTSPPEDSISDLAFSPQAELLAISSWDKKVRIYEVNPQGDTQGRALYEHQAPVLSTRFFPDGTKVVSGGCDNAVRAYDIQSGQTIQIGQHDAPVSSVRLAEVGGAAGPIVASASWDKTLRYWDTRQPQPVSTIQLPDRAYAMDTQKQLLVVGTADRQMCQINLANPATIFQTVSSPLKWQTRVITCYPDGTGYAVGSIEGRCAIQYVDPERQKKDSFAFKCHREQKNPPAVSKPTSVIYALNAISFHPVFGTFSTAGSDGFFHNWDKDSRYRLRGSPSVGGTIPCTAFNRNGTIFAYAVSYDWSKGHQFNTQNYPNTVKLHAVAEEEVKPRQKK